MICKRVRKNMKQLGEDIFENITDKQAYSVMFTVHKASKFGQYNQKKTSKIMSLGEEFFNEGFNNESITLETGHVAKLSF
jgi:hypothetical protein